MIIIILIYNYYHLKIIFKNYGIKNIILKNDFKMKKYLDICKKKLLIYYFI